MEAAYDENSTLPPGLIRPETESIAEGMVARSLAQQNLLMFEKGYPQLKVLASIRSAKFRRLVKPGDVLHLEAWEIHLSARGGKVKGEARVNNEKAAEGEIVFGIISGKRWHNSR